MKITRDNYEIFFLDYLEGNLDEKLVNDFIGFLEENQDLRQELQLFEPVEIPRDEESFSRKRSLYRSELNQNETFDHQAVAWLEGDLTGDEAAEFERWTEKHPEMKAELERYKKTILESDLSVTFKKKSNLYRYPETRSLLWWSMRIAAILLVAVMLWSIWPDQLTEITSEPALTEIVSIPGEIPAINDVTEEAPAAIDQVVAEIRSVPEKSVTSAQNQTVSGLPAGEKHTAPARREEFIISESLPVKVASLELTDPEPMMASLIPVDITEIFAEEDAEMNLSDKVIDRLGINDFNFSKLVKSGLRIAGTLTNDRISYGTGPEGDIVALSLETRVLGLRIPVGKGE